MPLKIDMPLKNWWRELIWPSRQKINLNQPALIFNILLFFSLLGVILLSLIGLINSLSPRSHHYLPFNQTELILPIIIFFLFLLWLSKTGRLKLAAWLLMAAYSWPMFYAFILHGADLPAGLLLAVLIIIGSGLLIGEYLVFISAAVISLFLVILTYLQENDLIGIENQWRTEKHGLSAASTYVLIFVIIALVAWLFARRLKQTLQRARNSERALRQERDSLEIKVLERTAQLRQNEIEKLNQLYRLAEFGRLSSGIFHDLINPLTAISLNLEQVNTPLGDKISSTQTCLNQARLAAHKMENLIASIKKQIQRDSQPKVFTLNEEVEQIIQIFDYKARLAKVQIIFLATEKIQLYGEAIKFWQIISNLLANAIEASETINNPDNKKIEIHLTCQNDRVVILVRDQGVGIAPDNLARIFEPFFSTKKEAGRGLGLGLAATKDITEKYFSGTITVTSQVGQGSAFTVFLPQSLAEIPRELAPADLAEIPRQVTAIDLAEIPRELALTDPEILK